MDSTVSTLSWEKEYGQRQARSREDEPSPSPFDALAALSPSFSRSWSAC